MNNSKFWPPVVNERYTDDLGNQWIYDGEMWQPDLNPETSNQIFQVHDSKCECGLKYSQDGGLHSDWCPMKEYELRLHESKNK